MFSEAAPSHPDEQQTMSIPQDFVADASQVEMVPRRRQVRDEGHIATLDISAGLSSQIPEFSDDYQRRLPGSSAASVGTV